MTGSSVPPFAVISGAQVQQALAGRERQITELDPEGALTTGLRDGDTIAAVVFALAVAAAFAQSASKIVVLLRMA